MRMTELINILRERPYMKTMVREIVYKREDINESVKMGMIQKVVRDELHRTSTSEYQVAQAMIQMHSDPDIIAHSHFFPCMGR